MRFPLTCLALFCSACSLVNSTDDLRNPDGGLRPDVQGPDVFDSPDSTPGDVAIPLVDAGPDADVGPGVDAGPPACAYTMNVDRPRFPTILHISAVGDDCPTRVTVQERVSGFGTMDEVEVMFGMDGGFFPFPHRVPIMDGARERQRTFVVNGVDVELQMPVEQLEVYRVGGVFATTDIEFAGAPSVDIDNAGNVVFASDDLDDLGAVGSNIFYWHIDPTYPSTGPDPHFDIDRPGRPQEAGDPDGYPMGPVDFHSPKLSDNGAMMAYIDTRNGNRVFFSAVGLAPALLTSVAASDELHLDLRDNGRGLSQLLVHQVDGRNHVFDVSPGVGFSETTLDTPMAGPGLLDGTGRYSAVEDPGVVFVQTSGVGTPTGACTESDADSLARTAGTNSAFACADGAVRRLETGEMEQLRPTLLPSGAWGLAGATDGLDLFLLRSEEGVRGVGYVLLDKDSNEAPLILNGVGGGVMIAPEGFAGAALSPDGEWVAYATPVGSGTEMQVFRARTRNP